MAEREAKKLARTCRGADCKKQHRNGSTWLVCPCGAFLLCTMCKMVPENAALYEAHKMGVGCQPLRSVSEEEEDIGNEGEGTA